MGLVGAACSAESSDDNSGTVTNPVTIATVQPGPGVCALVPYVPAFLQHCGDVTIASQADADQYQGIWVIVGNVTLSGGHKLVQATSWGDKYYKPGLEVAMPDLLHVTKNLTIDGDRASKIELPKLGRVGGALTVTLRHFATMQGSSVDITAVTQLLMPALANVGGNLSLKARRDSAASTSSGGKQYEFGLDQVTSVGGNVSLDDETLPGSINGLRGLASIPGDLSMDWKDNDLTAQNLLTHLTNVDGNLELLASSNADQALPELATIGGNLKIAWSPANTLLGRVRLRNGLVLPKLAKVLGDVVLDRTSPDGCIKALGSLKKVSGHFIIRNTHMIGHFGVTGATSLTLGGLEISDSDGIPPFFSDLKLGASASVVLEDNPNMCSCTLSNFSSALAAAGWPGTVQLLGSNGNQTCTPCPSCP